MDLRFLAFAGKQMVALLTVMGKSVSDWVFWGLREAGQWCPMLLGGQENEN